MGKGPTQERAFEVVLSDRGVSEKDIGWVLSKLDSQEYVLDDCHYMARILSKESETKAKEIFISRYFTLNIKGANNETKLNDLFQECIDKKKCGHYLKSNSELFVSDFQMQMLMVKHIYLYMVLIKNVERLPILIHTCFSLRMR